MVSIKRFQSDLLHSLELNPVRFGQGIKDGITSVCRFNAIALSFQLVCNMVHKNFMNKILSRYNKEEKKTWT
jgi:hypothetical protein